MPRPLLLLSPSKKQKTTSALNHSPVGPAVELMRNLCTLPLDLSLSTDSNFPLYHFGILFPRPSCPSEPAVNFGCRGVVTGYARIAELPEHVHPHLLRHKLLYDLLQHALIWLEHVGAAPKPPKPQSAAPLHADEHAVYTRTGPSRVWRN